MRLIDENGTNCGIVPLEEALRRAQESTLDLVQMDGENTPVVCKIMDHGKHLFHKKKQRAAARRRQHRVHLKEIKFRAGTEDADYQVKLRNLVRFLEQGDKVKITLRFRGREMVHQELGEALLQRVQEDLDPWAVVEQEPVMERRQLTMTMTPRKKGQRKTPPANLQLQADQGQQPDGGERLE